MANKYWHVLHCSSPPITDKKSLSLVQTNIFLFVHFTQPTNNFYWRARLPDIRNGLLGFRPEFVDSIDFFINLLPYTTEVNQFDIVNNFQYSFDMIFGLVPFLRRPVSQSEQLSAVQCHTGIPPPPQYWTIEQWGSAHWGCRPYSHLLPHFFPLCGANYVSDTRHVHLVDTLAA